MASNNSLAEFNLSKEPELVEGREKIKELSEIGEQLTQTVEEKTKILSEQIILFTKNLVIVNFPKLMEE